MKTPQFAERGNAQSAAAAMLASNAMMAEHFGAPHFRYDFRFDVPKDLAAVQQLRAEIEIERSSLFARHVMGEGLDAKRLIVLERELAAQPHEEAWRDNFHNTVLTAGGNDLLTKYWTGSSYTAAWYLGLITSTSFSAISAADTAASHSGWLESTAYSNSTRPAITFGSASSRSIATSSAVSYSINASDTIEGGFTATVSTKSATTGLFYSAGTFSGGTQPVTSGGTLSVSLTQSV